MQKGAELMSAYAGGSEVQDAVALLQFDNLFIESFYIDDDVLWGRRLSCAIGRVAGQDGRRTFAIENATRIVVFNQHINLLWS